MLVGLKNRLEIVVTIFGPGDLCQVIARLYRVVPIAAIARQNQRAKNDGNKDSRAVLISGVVGEPQKQAV